MTTTRLPALLLPALLLIAAPGCIVTPPLGDLPQAPDAKLVEVLDEDYLPFRVSPTNRYAVVMSGRRFTPPTKGRFSISTADDVLAGKKVEDPWVKGDVSQLTKLLLSKGYDVYRMDYGQVTPRAMKKLLKRIAFVAKDETKLFVAYSGEGDSTGWRTRAMSIRQNEHIIPPGVTVTPPDLFGALATVRGRKAVLINACEAGVFAEEGAKWAGFRGVVIAACARGFATTPHEPSGTTAIFAAFLELYSDEPSRMRNLATTEIDRAGGLWTNLAHKWKSLWGKGLPLSYKPAIFVSGDFWF